MNLFRTDMKNVAGFKFNSLLKMGKVEVVSMESVLKVCKALDYGIYDFMELEK